MNAFSRPSLDGHRNSLPKSLEFSNVRTFQILDSSNYIKKLFVIEKMTKMITLKNMLFDEDEDV